MQSNLNVVEILPQSCDVGGTSHGSGRSDRARDNEGSSGRPDSESEHGNGHRKFKPSRKQPRKSHLEMIALQAWENQALVWDEKSLVKHN